MQGKVLNFILLQLIKGSHDIQNVIIRNSLPGQIRVTGELVDRSIATGVFVVLYSLTNSEDVRYIAKQTEGDKISLIVTGLTGAEYRVSTFAFENGLPFPRVVTSPRNIRILLSSHQGWSVIMLHDYINLST